MPELPEVETIRTQLSEDLPLVVDAISFSKFAKLIVKEKKVSIEGETLLNIGRKGKVLDFYFSGNKRMISGLGMSGSWQISGEEISVKHAHIKLKFLDGDGKYVFMAYVDPRRFGKAHIVDTQRAEVLLARLGVDVSSHDFTSKYLFDQLQKRGQNPVKAVLLEQAVFAGIGNYMASEICALAGVLPSRQAREVSKAECAKMIKGCHRVIERSVESGGMTFHGGYVDASGKKGEGLKNLVVFYQKLCGMCGSAVVKSEIKGRGTYHCPSCQK